MKDDIIKTLMGLGFITLVVLASVGIGSILSQVPIPEYESVEVNRPEDVQRAIDLPLDPITDEEFKQFQKLNKGKIDDQ